MYKEIPSEERYEEAANMAYKEVVRLADKLHKAWEDSQDEDCDIVDDLFSLFADADILAGEISLLIHPTYELKGERDQG